MEKKEAQEISDEIFMADVLLRLTALEKLLISKGLITQEEYANEMDNVTAQLAKTILEKAKIPGDIDAIVKDLQTQKTLIKNTKN